MRKRPAGSPSTRYRRAPTASVALALAVATSGCNWVLGIGPTDPAADASVAASGDTALDSWSCLGHVDLNGTNAEPYAVRLRAFDVSTRLPPPGLSIVACWALADDCSDPLVGPLTPDDQGWVEFSLPANYEGRLEFTSPTTLPGLLQVVRPVAKMAFYPAIQLVSPAGAALAALKLGAMLDPTRGHIMLQAIDCAQQPGAGVVFRLEDDTPGEVFYFYNEVPTRAPEGTAVEGGGGGIVNVPPGFVRVRAERAATGELVSRFAVQVRAGWMTYALVEPA